MITETLSPNQRAFAGHMLSLWNPANELTFSHCYRISRSRVWRDWRARFAQPVDHWWCASLGEASQRYAWPEKSGFMSFGAIGNRLRSALAGNDDAAVRQACLQIFEWGGVARKPDDKSRLWVERQAANGNLVASLQRGTRILRFESEEPLRVFDGHELAMNAAMTKVYAAADPERVIIYDGRVGAAMGMLVRGWLEKRGERVLPSDLKFGWGAAQTKTVDRNPSRGAIQFPSLYKPSSRTVHQDAAWASFARKAAQILRFVADNSGEATVGDIEKALFMVGYHVGEPSPLPHPIPLRVQAGPLA